MKTMLRTAICAVVLVCLLDRVKACDICGCAIGNTNPFLFPSASRHFIGLSGYYRSYRIQSEDGYTARFYSNTLLLTGQYAISNKWRIQASIPYIVNNYAQFIGTSSRQGFGDISLVAEYNLFNGSTGISKHLVTVSGGIKLNTASNTPALTTNPGMIDLQTGSGSTDYLLAAGYRYSRINWIVQAQASYRYNNADKTSGLRFGDNLAGTVNIYRKIPFSSLTVTPYLGGTMEHRMDDARNHVLVNRSGGSVLLGNAGLDINTRKLAIGINCQLPLYQSVPGGTISEQARFNTHIFFSL